MADYLDQLLARGVISDDAAARAMTHWPQQGEERLETSPPPYRQDTLNFAGGGIHGVLKGRGVDTPEWADRAADVIHSPAFNDALGATPLGVTREGLNQIIRMTGEGKTRQEIADALGVSRSFVQRALGREGMTKTMYDVADARAATMAEVRRLDEAGMLGKDIADSLGISRAAVSGFLRKGGQPSRMERRFQNLPIRKEGDRAGSTVPPSDVSDWEVGPDGTLTRTVGRN